MILGTVTELMLLEHIDDNLDYCKITIDFDELYIFGDYNRLLDFLNHKVTYDVKPDMYKGEKITTVVNLVIMRTIQTLSESENIRLIPKDNKLRVGCTFDSTTLQYGNTELGVRAYLSSMEEGSSLKTTWVDLTMIDRNAKVFQAKFFTKGATSDGDVMATIKNCVGRYVSFDITSTKFGYQLNNIQYVTEPVVMPPEVETAASIILSEAEKDDELYNYIIQYDFIESLKKIIDLEPGYHLVRIASELSLINAVENISNLYNSKLLKRAAITSRGYLLRTKTKFSRPTLNVNKVMKTNLADDRELLLILDPAAEEEASVDKNIYMQIARFANRVVNERRDLGETENNGIDLLTMRDVTGGLF